MLLWHRCNCGRVHAEALWSRFVVLKRESNQFPDTALLQVVRLAPVLSPPRIIYLKAQPLLDKINAAREIMSSPNGEWIH